jgi:predicted nucleic acid-binding protein
MTLVDSNVLLDVFSESEPWVAWSKQQLVRAARRGPVVINDVIYAEISVRFTSFESLDAVLKKIVIDVAPIPRPALFFAGKAFQQYRSVGGLRTGVLSDSLLVPMPQFRTSRSLLATSAVIAIIFRQWN